MHSEGRRSAIELVGHLAASVPPAVLDAHAQLLFLPLVLRLGNDDDAACRRASLDALRTLLARASAAAFATLYKYVEGWLGAGAAAAQPAGSKRAGGESESESCSGSEGGAEGAAGAAAPSHVLLATAAQVRGHAKWAAAPPRPHPRRGGGDGAWARFLSGL